MKMNKTENIYEVASFYLLFYCLKFSQIFALLYQLFSIKPLGERERLNEPNGRVHFN